MKTRQTFFVALSGCILSGIAWGAGGSGGGAPAPAPAPRQAPPSRPPPPQNSDSGSRNTPSQNTPSQAGKGDKDPKSKSKTDDKRPPNYDPRYQYGYPSAQTTGVYYPGQNPNQSSSPNSSTTSTPGSGAPATQPTADSDGSLSKSAGWKNAHSAPATQPAPTPADPELAAAAAELNAAMDTLRETLKSRLDYQSALADKKAAQDEARNLHESSDVNPSLALAAAQRGLDASKRLAQIEHEAMAKDEKVASARARFEAAQAAHRSASPTASAK